MKSTHGSKSANRIRVMAQSSGPKEYQASGEKTRKRIPDGWHIDEDIAVRVFYVNGYPIKFTRLAERTKPRRTPSRSESAESGELF